MKKLASVFLSMLLFVSALSMDVSASSNGVSSTDFKVIDGEMVEIESDINSSFLPPLDELIPEDAYRKGLPFDTKEHKTMEEGHPVDYIGAELNTGLINAYQLIRKFPQAKGFTNTGDYGNELYLPMMYYEEMAAIYGDSPFGPKFRITEVRYKTNTWFSEDSIITYEEYWNLVGKETVASGVGGRISKSFTTTHGFAESESRTLVETIGLNVPIGGWHEYLPLLADLNYELRNTFTSYQVITESYTKTNEYHWGDFNPNGIPYIGGLYQLHSQYTIEPDPLIENEMNNSGYSYEFKPVVEQKGNHYRVIQADYHGE